MYVHNIKLEEVIAAKRNTLEAHFLLANKTKRVIDTIKNISFYPFETILFTAKDKAYLLVNHNLIEAESIVVYSKHKHSYAIKNGDTHTLFYQDKQCFTKSDAKIQSIALTNEAGWIISYKEHFVHYSKDNKIIESFKRTCTLPKEYKFIKSQV